MKTCILFIILFVTICSAKHGIRLRNNNKQIKISQDYDEVIEQHLKNEPAQILYETHPDGEEYNYDKAIETTLWIRITSKSISRPSTHSVLTERVVTLNRNAIFIYEQDEGVDGKSYRGQIQGLELRDLISDSDDLQNNECCKRVEPIQKDAVTVDIDDTETSMRCFRSLGKENVWMFCSDNVVTLQTFRSNVRLHAMASWNHFLHHPQFIYDALQKENWSYGAQGQWGGLCNYGQAQSPVELNPMSVKDDKDISLQFNYHNKTKTNSVVQWSGKDVEVVGQFGSISFTKFDLDHEQVVTEYHANKITFKTGSEHKIDAGEQFDGEVQVHHSSDDGQKAILSFMIRATDSVDNDEKKEVQKNKFFDQLLPDMWEHGQGWSMVNEEKLNLDLMYDGYTQLYFKKDFFYYVGSTSEPPCTEGVHRFVMSNAIYVTHAQWVALLQNVIAEEDYDFGNLREVQPVGLRTVYYHNDLDTKCAVANDWPYNTLAEDDIPSYEEILQNQGKVIKKTTKQVETIHHTQEESTSLSSNQQEVSSSELTSEQANDAMAGEVVQTNESEKDQAPVTKRRSNRKAKKLRKY